MSRAVTLGGCVVDLCTEPQVLDHVEDALRDTAGGALAIASANLDHLHHFGTGRPFEGRLVPPADSGLRWITLLDGYPLVRRVAQITGEDWPRLPGSDLIYPVLELAVREHRRVGFLGGTAENHRRLRVVLPTLYPDLQVAGYWAPAREELLDGGMAAGLAREIREAGVEILFVGLGKPRQEQWISDFGTLSGAKVLLAFGAATDFLTGHSERAPRWMQENGLEWVHRLSKEPKRLSRRYLIEGPGAARLLLDTENNIVGQPSASGSREVGRRIRSVGCLIVTYNSGDHIQALLESIPDAAAGLKYRVVVVDNDSTDATLKVLAEFPEVKAVSSGRNLGYAAGINIGLTYLSQVDAVAILNPDLTLEPGALVKLADGLRDWHVGVTVPIIRTPSGHVYRSLRREPTILGALGEATFGSRLPRRPLFLADTLRAPHYYTKRRDVDWASGAAWMIASDCLKVIGKWNERYFLYSEETEYARRVRQAGFRIRFIPSAGVLHIEGGSGQSPQLASLLAENRIRDFASSHSRARARIFRSVVLFHHLIRASNEKNRDVLRGLLHVPPMQSH